MNDYRHKLFASYRAGKNFTEGISKSQMAEPIIIVNHPQEVGPSSNQGLAKISHLPRTNEYGMLSVFLLYEWWKYYGILMLVLQLRLVM